MREPYGPLRSRAFRIRDQLGSDDRTVDPPLFRLLGLLQRQLNWAGADLAEHLDVETRTLRRDVDRLRALGYTIEGTPGAGGGYRLVGGNDLLPLVFEEDEATAIAVVLGVSAGAAVPGIERGALKALAKLDRLLPNRLRLPVESLRATTVTLSPSTEPVSSEALLLFAQACDNHQRATFSYRDQGVIESERRVEPHRLVVATDRRWYLVAYDLDRDAWRTFRVDRAGAVVLTGHTFLPRHVDDPAKMVAEAISTMPYSHRAVVRIHAPASEVARQVDPHVGMVTGDDAMAELVIGVDEFDWLAGYLMGLGYDFEVVEPPELRRFFASRYRRLLELHRGVVEEAR